MTKKQQQLYFREWGKVRRHLRAAGYSPKEADAERLEIHRRRDLPKSSKNFNKTTNLDAFITECRLILGSSAVDVTDQPRKRLVHAIRSLGLDDAYLNKLALDKGHGPEWQALKPEQLQQLLFTAKARARSRAETHPF